MTATVRVAGRGVHGDRPCTVSLHRRDGPVAFRRGGREVAARFDRVVDTRACTTLGGDGVRVATVEHLLAALHVRGVWEGLLIEVDADELPILDGSAGPWAEALDALAPFPDPPTAIAARGEARDGGEGCAALRDGPRGLDVAIDFRHPAIGAQRWRGAPDAWPDLLTARTFGFASDAGRLRAAGLARGASEANAIVFGEHAPTLPLRFDDEPVRHKALDALGDLYLLGAPFAGHLEVRRGGHALHNHLVSVLASAARAGGPA